jgi:PKD repeat protein
VTWNDYEEATEIETGIDNCVSVSASVSGSTLNWSITGDESTIDHYTAFISADGQNLMPLGDFPAGTRALNLAGFGFNAGTYSVFVKAVGKPSLLNHMSAAAAYVSAKSPQPPVAQLSLSPGSGTAPVTVTASTASSTDPQGSALTSSINFGDGTTAAGPAASHTYANPGTYTVTAVVTDAMKLQSQASATASVSAPLTLNVVQPANNSTVAAPIHVVANGSAPGGVDALQVYLDHALIYQINASSFDTTLAAAPGAHLVVVKLWDKLGNAYMQSLNVSVATPLVTSLTITPTAVTAGGSVTATVSATSGTISSSQINWGDGTNSPGPTASHVYSTVGSYSVTSIATSNVGTTSQATATVTVNAPVTLMVSQPANGATVHSPIPVSASGSAPSGVDAMQIYLDGTLVYQINASSFSTAVPASAGTHAVLVKLWDKLGNPYKQSTTVNVVPTLVTSMSLNFSTIAVGASVTATLNASSGTIASSTINWGDGTSSPGRSAAHTYATAGSFTITGNTSDVVGPAPPATATVTVEPRTTVVLQSPSANATVPESLQVQGYASSPVGIVAMQIYLDGVLVYQNSLSQVNTVIGLTAGTHRVTLKAWDNTGFSYMQSVNVTAQ